MLMAIILNTPFDVMIAMKSPRKDAQIIPSIEAEWRIEVGNTLYIFFI